MVRASVAAKERRRLRKDLGGFDSVQASGRVSFADDCIVTRCSLHSGDGDDGNIAGLSAVGGTVYKYPTLRDWDRYPSWPKQNRLAWWLELACCTWWITISAGSSVAAGICPP